MLEKVTHNDLNLEFYGLKRLIKQIVLNDADGLIRCMLIVHACS